MTGMTAAEKIGALSEGDAVEYPDGTTADVVSTSGQSVTLDDGNSSYLVTRRDPDAKDFEIIEDEDRGEPEGVLREAARIADHRREAYGDPEPNMRKTARMWNAYLGLEGDDAMDATDAAQMMTMLKIARHATGETDRDNFVDGAGYQRVAAEAEGVSEE